MQSTGRNYVVRIMKEDTVTKDNYAVEINDARLVHYYDLKETESNISLLKEVSADKSSGHNGNIGNVGGWLYMEYVVTGACVLVATVLLVTVVDQALGADARTGLPGDTVLSCYYTVPSGAAGPELQPTDIRPDLCTHINVAFARILNKQIYLDQTQYTAIREVVKLKSANPSLKILVSVGGAGDDDGFSDMVADHASRKVFIKSIKYLLRNYSIDGVDLDWEFPAVHSESLTLGRGRERQHFSQLLREIRAEYLREKRNYLLTVAVAAPEPIVDAAYDIDQLNLYVDFVNLMSYDYHSYNRYTPFTGLNSPLYARPGEHLYTASLNINYTIHMYMSKGLDRNKIVVGVPTYGHTFRLVNAHNAAIGAPAADHGHLGSGGFVNYPDVCTFQRKFKGEVITVQDSAAKVPYLYRNDEWVSYDDPSSVTMKATFVNKYKLRGAMIYSLNADDYAGVCCEGRFPLARSVRGALLPAPADPRPKL